MDDNESEENEKRKSSSFQKEDLPDLAVAWVIIAMTTAIATGFVTGGYMIVSAITANFPMVLLVILLIVVFGGLILFIEKAMEAAA